MIKGAMKDNLKKVIATAKRKPFYSDRYKKVKNFNFNRLPFIDSSEIQSVYADQKVNGSTVFFTSGTTSNPKAIYYSDSDIEYFSDYIKWFCSVEKAIKNETVIVLMDHSFWGVGYITNIGHIKAGNIVVPVDNDLPLQKIKEIIETIRPTIISSLPSVLLEIKDAVVNYNFRIIETTGEKLSDKDRKSIEAIYGGEVYDAYGLTEAVIGTECSQHDGYHFNGKKIKLDIVDPITRQDLGKNEWGELVITTLNTNPEGTQIIKYLSGDRCRISYDKCKCGLSHPRIWVDRRLKLTVDLHEGYRIEVDEIKKIVNLILGGEFFIKVDIIKINESKYLLKIFLNVSITKEKQEKIKNSFIDYSFELMHMIRNKKLLFKFYKTI